MTAVPPPPPPLRASEVQEKVPAVAALVPIAALLAVLGVVTPWFKPQVTGTVNGVTRSGDAVDSALYSWKEGRLGLIAPVVLVVVAVGVVKLLRGRNSRFHRGATSPVVSAARGSLIAGAVAVVAVLIAYFLLPSGYHFTDGARRYSWDEAQALFRSQGISDAELGQGPQLGLWLTVAGGVLAILAGALMLAMRTKTPNTASYVPVPQWQPSAPPAWAPPAPPAPPAQMAPPQAWSQPAPQQTWTQPPPAAPPAPPQQTWPAPGQ